LNFITLHIV